MRFKRICVLLIVAAVTVTGCSKSEKKKTSNSIAGSYYTGDSVEEAREKFILEKDGSFQTTMRFRYIKELTDKKQVITMNGMDTDEKVAQIAIKKENDTYCFYQLENGKEVAGSKLDVELKEGDDGFDFAQPFDGSYQQKKQGLEYVFHNDGVLDVISTGEYIVSEDTITVKGNDENHNGSGTYKFSDDKKKLTIQWNSGQKQVLVKE